MRRLGPDNSIADIPLTIREAFRGAVDLILPFRCLICGDVSDTEDRFENYEHLYMSVFGKESELHICGKCLSALNISDEDLRWFLCLSNPVENDPCPGLPLFMPFPYKGILERAIPGIKFGKKIELARMLGIILGSCVKNEGILGDLIVPIPLSEARLEERGFN